MNFARRLCSHLPPLVTAILGAACVAATPQLEFESKWLDAVTNGALHGTFYAHAALAGLWVACGPGTLVVRLVTVAMWLPLLPYVRFWAGTSARRPHRSPLSSHGHRLSGDDVAGDRDGGRRVRILDRPALGHAPHAKRSATACFVITFTVPDG